MKKSDQPYWTQYTMQKNAATQRQIRWNLSYEDWIDFWGDDVEKRGRKPDSLVMGITDKNIGFHVGNIYKTSKSNLISEVLNKQATRKPVHTPNGDFSSLSAAARDASIAVTGVIFRAKSDRHPEWYYLDKEQ